MITVDTVKSAQAGDFEATRDIVNEMEGRVSGIARRAARRKGGSFDQFVDEYRATANVALWEAVNAFTGNTVDEFCAYAYRSMDERVSEEFRGEAGYSEGDRRLMSAFTTAVNKAEGDVYLAEKLSQIHAYTKRGRLSADAAHAARLMWQGCDYLDRPIESRSDHNTSLGDLVPGAGESPEDLAADVATPAGNPNKIRAAYRFLLGYVTVPPGEADRESLGFSLDLLSKGAVSTNAVEDLSDNVRVPKDRADRLAVLGAVGILARASDGAASLSATPEDEYNLLEDEYPEQRASVARRQTVRALLDKMVDNYRLVLSHTFGVGGVHAYGRGEQGDDAGLSDATGLPVHRIPDLRDKGMASFGKRWVKAMAISSQHAEVLAVAMKDQKRKGGRK